MRIPAFLAAHAFGRQRLVLLLGAVIAAVPVLPRPTSAATEGGQPAVPSTASAFPSDLTPSNGKVFFVADDGDHGRQLWASDGTAQGTALVAVVREKESPAIIENLTDVGGVLFFTVDETTYIDEHSGVRSVELWTTDGTAPGTVRLRRFDSTSIGAASAAVLAARDGVLLFVVDDGAHGHELWKSDGTADGTVLVKDVYAGPHDGVISYDDFLIAGGVLFFEGDDGGGGLGLWKSDATEAGTVLVKRLPLPLSGPYSLAAIDKLLFFAMNDYEANAFELWRSDGSEAGTWRVESIPANARTSGMGQLTNVDAVLFFVIADQGGPGGTLWRSDGTAAGTAPVRGFRSQPRALAALDGTLFFLAADRGLAAADELWRSDGTAGGTVQVSDIYGEMPGLPYADQVTAFAGATFFTTAAGGLWRSDGTPSSTQPLRFFVTRPTGLRVAGDTVFFAGDDGWLGSELWRSDGTAAGTRLVKDINAIAKPAPCVGDCNDDDIVTVDEIIALVQIGLGKVSFAICPASQLCFEGPPVTVDCIMRAVNSVLVGCPVPAVTPTATATPTVPAGRCRNSGDCMVPSNSGFCLEPGGFPGCGPTPAPVPTQNRCRDDSDCVSRGNAFICNDVDPRTCQVGLACMLGCLSDRDCPTAQGCASWHRCVPRLCATDADCPPLFACDQVADSSVRRCARRTCAGDVDCGSGICVTGSCYADLGTCVLPPE
jgi:ELWxxDGT repeat protein